MAIKVFVETGTKKIFAGAVDWPGWCRAARDEESALQALIDYGPRYARVLRGKEIEFPIPTNSADLIIVERQDGNAATDFGAPNRVLDLDYAPLDRKELNRLQTVLRACWQAFDRAVEKAAGVELQKGPRGGGRDLEGILNHVTGADQGYLSSLGWKYKPESEGLPAEELPRTRQAILNALEASSSGNLPVYGPRGGKMWPVRYYIRRSAWHLLDHAWEIENRSQANLLA